MGLQLGGPDVRENIVPQWAFFQATGEWRMHETSLFNLAKTSQLPKYYFTCHVIYVQTKSYIRSCFPSQFIVTCRNGEGGPVIDSTPFDQKQDLTDDARSQREMDLADAESDYSEYDDDDDEVKIPSIRSGPPTGMHLNHINRQTAEDEFYSAMKAAARSNQRPDKDKPLPDEDSKDMDWVPGTGN